LSPTGCHKRIRSKPQKMKVNQRTSAAERRRLYAAASARSADCGLKIEATGALTPRVLGLRLFDVTLGGRGLGLGIVDRRFGQLGDPIRGCDCI
jgi:hypothetical protein